MSVHRRVKRAAVKGKSYKEIDEEKLKLMEKQMEAFDRLSRVLNVVAILEDIPVNEAIMILNAAKQAVATQGNGRPRKS